MTSRGSLPSTLQPTDTAVPRISLQPFARSLAQLRGRMTRAISMMSDIVTLPVCLMFFSCEAETVFAVSRMRSVPQDDALLSRPTLY